MKKNLEDFEESAWDEVHTEIHEILLKHLPSLCFSTEDQFLELSYALTNFAIDRMASVY